MEEGASGGWTWGFYDEGTGTGRNEDADYGIITDKKGQPVSIFKVRATYEVWVGLDESGVPEVKGNDLIGNSHSFLSITDIPLNNGGSGTYPDLGTLKRDISRIDKLKPCFWE